MNETDFFQHSPSRASGLEAVLARMCVYTTFDHLASISLGPSCVLSSLYTKLPQVIAVVGAWVSEEARQAPGTLKTCARRPELVNQRGKH